MKAPDRPWDYQCDEYGGSFFWFEEMVYMDGTSVLKNMVIDQNNNMLRKASATIGQRCGRCSECNDDKLCIRNFFSDDIQKAKDDWWFRVFESKFLGELE